MYISQLPLRNFTLPIFSLFTNFRIPLDTKVIDSLFPFVNFGIFDTPISSCYKPRLTKRWGSDAKGFF